ncbi:hypothetical protein L7E55_01725 [Pelotomaculum isophthalicicum JI]|uniref:Uncharacterized protein n=1 Tax=Pelotomaculum isophthalicicum JI TaxID=947010 RepID=A0A9X4H081_9FIRM|nr:hypothetical protein [Pelotomaculum isophthalicicum]MDF9407086.1 hypothetical protein [Pelotomaculum isophthalicicum JI]
MEKKLIIENHERLSVLSGREKIDDMIVFLAYRKLVRTLAASSSAYAYKSIKEAQGK